MRGDESRCGTGGRLVWEGSEIEVDRVAAEGLTGQWRSRRSHAVVVVARRVKNMKIYKSGEIRGERSLAVTFPYTRSR